MEYGNYLNRDDILENLEKLNEVLAKEEDYLKLVLGGDANVILPEIRVRLTGDIDTISKLESLFKYKKVFDKLSINNDMLRVATLASGYEDRAWLYKSYSNLDIYLLEMYDFIISKLPTNRKKSSQDMDDIICTIDDYEDSHGIGEFDFGELKERVYSALQVHIGSPSTIIENFNYLSHRYFRDERL